MLISVCLACVLLAVWWGIPPPPDRKRRARAGPARLANRPRIGGVTRWVGLLAVATGGIIGAGILGGPRAAVLAAAAAAVGLTVRGLLRQRAVRRSERRAAQQVARGCSLLASHLRVGLVPSEALAAAAGEVPVLREGANVLELGGDPIRIWQQQAKRGGHGGLRELAQAWQVSTQTGAPMSAMLDQVAAGLTADESLGAVVASELSAPRATGKVMAALPLLGIVLGYLLGGDPITWLLEQPVGWGCLVGGAVLACLGVLWIEALARRAAR